MSRQQSNSRRAATFDQKVARNQVGEFIDGKFCPADETIARKPTPPQTDSVRSCSSPTTTPPSSPVHSDSNNPDGLLAPNFFASSDQNETMPSSNEPVPDEQPTLPIDRLFSGQLQPSQQPSSWSTRDPRSYLVSPTKSSVYAHPPPLLAHYSSPALTGVLITPIFQQLMSNDVTVLESDFIAPQALAAASSPAAAAEQPTTSELPQASAVGSLSTKPTKKRSQTSSSIYSTSAPNSDTLLSAFAGSSNGHSKQQSKKKPKTKQQPSPKKNSMPVAGPATAVQPAPFKKPDGFFFGSACVNAPPASALPPPDFPQ